MSRRKSRLFLFISLFSLFASFSSSLSAETGYRCLVKEPVICPAVVPTCIKLPDGDFTLEPFLSEECFDKTACYKQESEELEASLDVQGKQIAKLQEENKKLKAKLRVRRSTK